MTILKPYIDNVLLLIIIIIHVLHEANALMKNKDKYKPTLQNIAGYFDYSICLKG